MPLQHYSYFEVFFVRRYRDDILRSVFKSEFSRLERLDLVVKIPLIGYVLDLERINTDVPAKRNLSEVFKNDFPRNEESFLILFRRPHS